MFTLRSIRHPWRLAAVCAVLSHLLLALAMAANHEVHEWIHGDADHEDHECVVQLLLHGGCDNDTLEPQALVALALAPETLPSASTADVPSAFLITAIFEHAPPPGM